MRSSRGPAAREQAAALPGKALLGARVVTLFLLVEIGLRTRSLPAVCRLLGLRLGATPSTAPAPAAVLSAADAVRAVRAVRAVHRVQGHWPWGGTCLRTSLVTGRLLRRHRPTLVLGVRREASGSVVAHAWLEIDGRSLDPQSATYAVLPVA